MFDPACVLTTSLFNKSLHMDPYASRLVGSVTRLLHVGTAISKYNKAIILSQRCQEEFLIKKKKKKIISKNLKLKKLNFCQVFLFWWGHRYCVLPQTTIGCHYYELSIDYLVYKPL